MKSILIWMHAILLIQHSIFLVKLQRSLLHNIIKVNTRQLLFFGQLFYLIAIILQFFVTTVADLCCKVLFYRIKGRRSKKNYFRASLF